MAAAVVVGLALAAIAVAPPGLLLYAVLLIVGGAASGLVTTLGPALASLAAGPDEQGDALALTGTFRAGALFAAPPLVGAARGSAWPSGRPWCVLAGGMLAAWAGHRHPGADGSG